jgi:tRNA (cmo5U34)-methyltransferase
MAKPPIDGFNKIAFAYDAMARIFIGNSIREAQRFFLPEIRQAKHILVLGGGTGWILRDILRVNPKAAIVYVEASSAMIARSKEVSMNKQITFLHGTESDIPRDACFDIVISNFYFDLFTAGSLQAKASVIKSTLAAGAKWLASDFVDTRKIYHRILLWVMYRFFRSTTGIEAARLPEWEKTLLELGMEIKASEDFKNGFIRSVVFLQKA